MKFGKKHAFTHYFHSRLGIAVLLLLVLLLGQSVYGRYVIEREMAARTDALLAELQALEGRKNSLEEKVDYMLGERGIEEEVRNNFDVAREGEQVIILVGEQPSVPLRDMAPTPPARPAWWRFWEK